MKTLQNNQKAIEIINQFEGVKVLSNKKFKVQTVIGPLLITLDLIPSPSFFSIFMRFPDLLNENQQKEFKRLIGSTEGLNPHSFKWNMHNENLEDLLLILKGRLNILATKKQTETLKAFVIKYTNKKTGEVNYIQTWAKSKLAALKNFCLLEWVNIPNLYFNAREVNKNLLGIANDKLYCNLFEKQA